MRPYLAVALILTPLPSLAQDVRSPVKPLACTVSASSDVIRIAICEETGTDEAMAAFGRIACDGVLPCGTWFWTEAADAPDSAPQNHDGLTQAQVTSSQGVFVAEQDMVIRIEAAAE